MIEISANEAKLIRKNCPSATIKRTVHRYYVEESKSVERILKRGIIPKREGEHHE